MHLRMYMLSADHGSGATYSLDRRSVSQRYPNLWQMAREAQLELPCDDLLSMFAPSDLLCLKTRCLMCGRWLDQPNLFSIASTRVKLDDKPLCRKLNQILGWVSSATMVNRVITHGRYLARWQ